ncbi:hypothetical protein K493DRAFT_350680 [Basidiobolus meristosporus CBS 931.73]|uniref:Small ribosomal subunit protein uS5 n=1 Tax=Basidiobolus meristosporus CBS 931.73 TaxID=1314790 RepID=A0A1Y1YG67_9FUNG|nr:hypothetical protein K493DRAFT_350680 [Basidiobolus meristosporus CBS 931.73]|eukprot:ORX96624.1 hypothetical protein K493DRAFT_350680 [Basidiobolus meristosporus CBS 931.73]
MEYEETQRIRDTKLGRLESQIIDHFRTTLKDEVGKIKPVPKQTTNGQRTRCKTFVLIRDSNGHVRLDVRCANGVATAIRSAIVLAKLNISPARCRIWYSRCPQPQSTLQLTGITDGYITARGSTRTLGNSIKATFVAVGHTCAFLAPDLWAESVPPRVPTKKPRTT